MSAESAGPRALAALTDERVFGLLARDPATRTEISAQLGISKPTASQSILRLQEFGLVSEGRSSAEGKRGRIPERYALRTAYGHVLGVDLSAERLALRASDLAGTVLAERSSPVATSTGAEQLLDTARALRDELQAELGTRRLATGISQAAPVLHAGNGAARVVPTPIFAASGADLAGLFDARSTLLDNDVNWMAVAEYAGRAGSMLLLYLGAGIGSALVIEGRLYRGRHGLVGELETQRLQGRTLLEHLDAGGLVDTRVLFEKLSDPQLWPALIEPLGQVLGNLLGYLDPDALVVTGPGASAALTQKLADRLVGLVPLAGPDIGYSPQGGPGALDGALAGARRYALAEVWNAYRQWQPGRPCH